MPFFPNPLQDGPVDRPRWFPAAGKHRFHSIGCFEDDDADEIHCEYIGTEKWLANLAQRKTAGAVYKRRLP